MSSDKTEYQPRISHWPCSLDMMNHEPLSSALQKHVSNAKERGRTTRVNVAFSMLRTCIPTEPRDRKLSKVETLRLATSYIGHLTNVIRARSEQDYGGEVCRRYGHSSDIEMERLAPKQICTFCLTDRRRCPQLTEKKSKEKNAIVNLRLQKNLPIYPEPTFKSEVHLHPICPQYVPCRIKKEPDESFDERI